jgi:phage shock protein E
MAYRQEFQALPEVAHVRVEEGSAADVDALVHRRALLLDLRDREEHDVDAIAGSFQVSRGKLERDIEGRVPDSSALILCYCNANNRGVLSPKTLQDMGYSYAKFLGGGLRAYRALSAH